MTILPLEQVFTICNTYVLATGNRILRHYDVNERVLNLQCELVRAVIVYL